MQLQKASIPLERIISALRAEGFAFNESRVKSQIDDVHLDSNIRLRIDEKDRIRCVIETETTQPH